MDETLEFKERLKTVIREQGGQKKIAEEWGISQSGVSSLLKAGGSDAHRLALRIFQLGYDLNWFFAGIGEPNRKGLYLEKYPPDVLFATEEEGTYTPEKSRPLPADPFEHFRLLFLDISKQIEALSLHARRQDERIKDLEDILNSE